MGEPFFFGGATRLIRAGSVVLHGVWIANFCDGASGAEPRRMSLWTLQTDTRYSTVSVYPPSHARWKGLEGYVGQCHTMEEGQVGHTNSWGPAAHAKGDGL